MRQGETSVAGVRGPQRFEHVGGKHIEVARRAKLLRDPFELGLDRLLILVADDIGKDGDGGAQTPQADAHLMQPLGAAGAHHRLIGDDLPEAVPRDGTERLPGRHPCRDVDLCGLIDLQISVREQRVAALGLSLHREPERHRLAEPAGEAKQFLGLPPLQLKLNFGDGLHAGPGGDFALIDGDLDLRAVPREAENVATDLRLEHRPQRRAHPFCEQRLERGILDAVEIRIAARDLAFPFEALDQLGLALGRLDGLHDIGAVLANA